MKTASATEIARRFVTYAPGRSDRFEEGVRNPDKDWADETSKAEPNYEEGVKKAIARKAFGKGVKKAGTEKQKSQTIKNITRWSEGVSGAEDIMAKAMGPVVAVMEATTLPPRYPKGDKRNYERVVTVGTALRKAKEEGRL